MKMLRFNILLFLSFVYYCGLAQTRIEYADSVIYYLSNSKKLNNIDEGYFFNGISFIDSINGDHASISRIQNLSESFKFLDNKSLYYKLAYTLIFRLQVLKLFDKQIEYGKAVIDFYEKQGDTTSKKYYRDILHSLRVPFRSTNRLSEGFDYYGEKLKKYFPKNDVELISLCYFVYGGFYMVQGLGDMATYYFKKSISYLNPHDTSSLSRMGSPVWLDRAGTLPFLYNRIGNYREAADMARAINALPNRDKTRNDSMNRSFNLRHFAEAKMMVQQMDSVEGPLAEAERLALLTHSTENIAGCYEVRGRYFFLLQKMDSAEKYLSTASKMIKDNNIPRNSPWGVFTPNYYLAQIEASQLKYQKAADLILSEITEMPNLKREILKEMKLLVSIYMAMGNNNDAHKAYEQYIIRQHDFDSTDQKNRVMSFENEQMLENLSSQKAIQEAEVTRQKKQKTFYLAGVLLLGMLLFFVFLNFRNQRRLNKMMSTAHEKERSELELKSQQSVLSERLRISRDLHDEVGATLSGIAMYTHLAKKQLTLNNIHATEKSLGVIEESSIEMVNKLSDIVWLFNPNQDSVHKLFEKLKDYAIELGAAKAMQVEALIDVSITDTTLAIEPRRNIYMICKEAINNAVKYSQSTSLHLKAEPLNGDIRFSITDTGNGFEQAAVKKGNGLENMEYRAKQIGATLQIVSNPGEGTRIIIFYKIARQAIVQS